LVELPLFYEHIPIKSTSELRDFSGDSEDSGDSGENNKWGVIYAEFGNNKHDRISKGVNLKKNNKIRKNTKKKVDSYKRFDNSVTLLLQLKNGNRINVKVFKNGKIQMTGVKNEKDGYDVIECVIKLVKITHSKVLELASASSTSSTSSTSSASSTSSTSSTSSIQIITSTSTQPHLSSQSTTDEKNVAMEKHVVVQDIDTLYPSNLAIHLINSDFKVNMELRRDLLYKVLNEEYAVISTYDPCIYPGVKIQYYYKHQNTSNSSKNGQCQCANGICNGKGDGITTTNCKKITISVFQSGCILITGVTKKEHIDTGYNFIVNVIKNHASKVKRVKLMI
jgi:TATA-box binding protein (TBP) (component of TFIID and TFIIIB)